MKNSFWFPYLRRAVRATIIATVAFGMALPTAAAEDDHKEASLRIGDNGKLVYIPDEQGNLIPDFSRAGYMGGGVRIPDVPTRITLEPSGDETFDDSPRIEKALADLAAMPLDKDGFRGALLLKRGTYKISRPIYLSKSGL